MSRVVTHVLCHRDEFLCFGLSHVPCLVFDYTNINQDNADPLRSVFGALSVRVECNLYLIVL